MYFSLFTFFILSFNSVKANYLLLPMDNVQKNHLKSYGIAYWVLLGNVELEWLLNYRGGSFLIPFYKTIQEECVIRGVSYEVITDARAQSIRLEIGDPEVNMEVVKMEKAPKIAVYAPKGHQPWDDAVTMVMTYAEIPYDQIYDSAVVTGALVKYDWLHLHHEDFTGQYGKFYNSYRNAAWYQQQVRQTEAMAKFLGFAKVSELKLGVALRIKEYVAGGGFLFTMCSGTDSYDIALSAEGVDICGPMYDGDPLDPKAQSKIDFNRTFAFENYHLTMDPLVYEFSDIDGSQLHNLPENQDVFTLFDFSAKWDIVPTMLCQNHTQVIKGFMGQTTDFVKKYIKSSVTVMGESKQFGTARYIHGTFGKGTWTFYGGHDPEDFRHYVGDPPTDLNLHPNSPGYRLILNNILFPAAKKKKQKT
ncbi:MAG TPA: asparagine synthetase B [Flavobacteriales bacterium]|nr:asparagine synthetase B [Flavobacteriales bacterium]